jgi:hypothetical protein
MELTIEQVREWLAENKDTEPVKAFFAEIVPKVEITADAVSPFLETPAGQQLIQPIADKRVSDALKTYKEGHYADELKADVAKKILELNPTETPAAKEIREIREELETEKKARKGDSLRRQIVEEAAKENVPSWWVDDFSGNTIDEAKVFLGKVKAHDEAVAERVRNELLTQGFKPGGGGEENKEKIKLSSLSLEETVDLEMKGELDSVLAQ